MEASGSELVKKTRKYEGKKRGKLSRNRGRHVGRNKKVEVRKNERKKMKVGW